jgi:DtxR family Mn-dependent transcriptional regulator
MNENSDIVLTQRENQVLEYLFYHKQAIRPGDLKKDVKLKHTTLNSILGRLETKGIIEWEKYGPVSLTQGGREQAEHLTNHHLIIEKYLKETLHISNKEAHLEALELAGNVSCLLIEAICTNLSISHEEFHPSFCNGRNYSKIKKIG